MSCHPGMIAPLLLLLSLLTGVTKADDTLTVGSAKLPCVFEDQELSPDVKSSIIVDLQQVLSWFNDVRFNPGGGSSNYSLGGKTVKIIERLYLNSPSGIFPEELTLFGDVIDYQGKKTFIINRQVVEWWRFARDRWNKNNTAIAELKELIQKLNSPPLDWLKTDIFQSMYGDLDPKHLDDIKNQMKSIRFGELAPLAVWLAKHEEEYFLAAKVPIYSVETNAFFGFFVFGLREKGWVMFLG